VKPARPSECYVYVQLPGEHPMVTAGKCRLDTNGRQPVGRFVYGQSCLARPAAVELDPIGWQGGEGEIAGHGSADHAQPPGQERL
jgi:hypothetical protein